MLDTQSEKSRIDSLPRYHPKSKPSMWVESSEIDISVLFIEIAKLPPEKNGGLLFPLPLVAAFKQNNKFDEKSSEVGKLN